MKLEMTDALPDAEPRPRPASPTRLRLSRKRRRNSFGRKPVPSREANPPTCAKPRFRWPLALDGWMPLVAFVGAAILTRSALPAWGFMWVLALALYAGCKWLTFREARVRDGRPRGWAAVGYLLFWPGMNASSWMQRPAGRLESWGGPVLRTGAGLWLIGYGLPWVSVPVVRGWLGMIGVVLVLHFGIFHLLSLGWRAAGLNAPALMVSPLRAGTLGEFWGRRWNRGFHDLASAYLFKPLTKRFGATSGVAVAFLVSGLIHELVITYPAAGGYGGPTLYFVLQAGGLLVEKRVGLSGMSGRLWTILVTALPAPLLFPPIFVERVILPMLKSLGAT